MTAIALGRLACDMEAIALGRRMVGGVAQHCAQPLIYPSILLFVLSSARLFYLDIGRWVASHHVLQVRGHGDERIQRHEEGSAWRRGERLGLTLSIKP